MLMKTKFMEGHIYGSREIDLSGQARWTGEFKRKR